MNQNYKNVLITGGAGRLGRYLFEEFKNEGYNVTLFDLKAPAEQPFPWEIERGTMFVRGDLTDLGDMMRAITLSKADAVVHVAAITHSTDMQPGRAFRPQMLPEDTTFDVNVMGTYTVMDACRRLGVTKVVFASSYYATGVGGNINKDKPLEVKYLPIDEEHPLMNQDTYGLSKELGEMILESYSRAYSIKCVAMRLMGVSYPGIRPIGVGEEVPKVASDWKGGPRGTTHQYSDCRDIAYAMRLAVDKDLENDYECFFHSSDNTFKGPTAPAIKMFYPDLADMADDIEGEDGLMSTKKMKKLLGFESQYTWKKAE